MTDINLARAPRLGRVLRVDTARVVVLADAPELVTRISVGSLVAVEGATPTEYLVGIVQGVQRDTELQEVLVDDADDRGAVVPGTRDILIIALVGTFWERRGEKANVFRRGAATFPRLDRAVVIIEGSDLRALMGVLATGIAQEHQLRLGTFLVDEEAAAVIDGDRFFQRHAAVVGSTGAGKSWLVALIAERAAALPHPNLIVLDVHGEYAPLVRGENPIGQGLRVAGPADLNTLDPAVLFLPYWLLNREEMLALVLDRSDQNAPNQASRFTDLVRELRGETAQVEAPESADLFTVDSPIPYRIEDLLDRLRRDNEEMVPGARGPKAGPWFDKLTRFMGRLEAKRRDLRYGFLFSPPPRALSYDWLEQLAQQLLCADEENLGVKVIDLSEVPSDVLPVVVSVLGRLIFDLQYWIDPDRRTSISLICDEAHLYLPERSGSAVAESRSLDVFERIAKEGRKYGVGLVVVSQRPAELNRTILSQCSNFLALRLANDTDQQAIRRLLPESLGSLVEALPMLDVGEAILIGDAVILPSRIKLDAPSVEPLSGTRPFWSEWANTCPDRLAIGASVEAMRRQTREPTQNTAV